MISGSNTVHNWTNISNRQLNLINPTILLFQICNYYLYYIHVRIFKNPSSSPDRVISTLIRKNLKQLKISNSIKGTEEQCSSQVYCKFPLMTFVNDIIKVRYRRLPLPGENGGKWQRAYIPYYTSYVHPNLRVICNI